jgi:hypothetical protein
MSAEVRLRYAQGGNDVEWVIHLECSTTTSDLLALLPLELTLKDYGKTELIAALSGKLSTRDAPPGHTAKRGDLCYYAPWGNLALFLKDFGSAPGLVLLGRCEGDFRASPLSSPVPALLQLANGEA